MDEKREPEGIVLTEAQLKSRRQRSIAIALALGVMVVLFFAVTIVKGPAVLNRPIGTFADLIPTADLPKRGGGGGGGGGGAFVGVPQAKKDMIGLLGELTVYHWLKARQPGHDIDACWVSSNSEQFTGRKGCDGLGYDFRIAFNKQTWFIEVKASTEDPCRFELGETEVRRARDVARSRSAERYVVAYVANVGSTKATTIDILPNPLGPDADGVLNIAGDSIRFNFGRRR